MKNVRTAVLALGLVLVVVLAGPGATTAQIAGPQSAEMAHPAERLDQTGTTTAGNETVTNTTNQSESVAPGARFAGVVGVQRAELESDVEERAFGHALNRAQTNDSKAVLVGNETEQIEQRLAAMESRMEQLEAAHENGTISQGAYQAQVATVSARINALERQINRTETAGMSLPAHVQSRHNLNETRFASLRTAAGNLSGPDVAAIARTIAGPNPGHPAGDRGPPDHAGPDGNMGPHGQGGTGTQANTSTRGPGNQTMGPSGNQSMGPSGNQSVGPASNTSMGPNQGQSNPNADNGNAGMETPPGQRTARTPSTNSTTAK